MTERELLDALARDADDAGTRLVAWLDDIDAPVLVALARDVIRERDEARREAAHWTDMANQADVSCQREKARAAAAQPASEGRADG